MDTGPLVGAVTGAHRAVADRLAALEDASSRHRAERLAELASVVHATTTAEETVLFPVVRPLLDDNGLLTDTCAAEHREVAARLDAMTGRVDAVGFRVAVQELARDVRHHMADEEAATLPLLAEALDAAASGELAAQFQRTIAP